MFSYELPIIETKNNVLNSQEILDSLNSIVVYNFHNLIFHERFFLFTVGSCLSSSKNNLASIAELYPNAS
jgi:hypothetical protein